MKANVIWKQNMTFTGQSKSGYPIQLDGNSNGATPMDLIAIGLAGCTAMDVISILSKKQQNVTQFEVRVDAQRSENHPKVFTHAAITYIVCGKGVVETALLRAIELSVTRYCSVHAMLSLAFPMDTHYEIYEVEDDGSQSLTFAGVYQEMSLD